MMKMKRLFPVCCRLGRPAALYLLVLGLVFVPHLVGAEKKSPVSSLMRIQAFQPGEKLTYEISWSNIVTAGIAVMEVKEEMLPSGKSALRFIASSRSVGAVDKFYPVNDVVQSVFDPQTLRSLSFSLNESHGKKKKRRGLTFDHGTQTVVSTMNDDPPLTMTIPDQVQDALSSLYDLRTREDFAAGKTHVINVHDSGKTWAVEIQTLGREKIKTPAGKFNTIKVKTFPRYEGVFMNKGEIFIWLTDDSRKIPVLMKSTISIGSIMTTLTSMSSGEVAH